MTVYAAAYQAEPQGQVALRAWGGGQWHDFVYNMNDDFVDSGARRLAYISDIILWEGHLWVILVTYPLLSSFRVPKCRLLRLNNQLWEETASIFNDADDAHWNGFVAVDGKLLIHGSAGNPDDSGRSVFTFWEMNVAGSVSVFAQTRQFFFNVDEALPRGVIISPTKATRLIIGDAFEDRFGYFDVDTKTFHSGSDPGGSCIFAMDVDRFGTVWAGDFDSFYYYSTDGGVSFSDAFRENPTFPEVWDMAMWTDRTLHAVGCNPAQIIRRTRTPTTPVFGDDWETVYTYTFAPFPTPGIGFMSCAPESSFGGHLIIGFGGEPYYYQNDVRGDGAVATVFQFDGTVLRDIGGGLDWLAGVHRLYSDGLGNNLSAGLGVKSLDFW